MSINEYCRIKGLLSETAVWIDATCLAITGDAPELAIKSMTLLASVGYFPPWLEPDRSIFSVQQTMCLQTEIALHKVKTGNVIVLKSVLPDMTGWG